MSWKPRIFLACLVAGIPAIAAADVLAPTDVKFNDMSVSQSLTGKPGDPAAGRKVFSDRKLGNCLACHAVEDQNDQLFHGEVGPPLDGAADRWSEAELRAIVADAKEVFSEETVMPGFYSLNVGVDVREDLVGKTILSAQEVEDVVAYLATLKE
jgi:sulfur-oxidizing protein SoxX